MSDDLLAFERQMLRRVNVHEARDRVRSEMPQSHDRAITVLKRAWPILRRGYRLEVETPPRWWYLTDAYVDSRQLPVIEFQLGRSKTFLTQAGDSLRIGVELDGHPYLPFPGGSYVHVALARWHGLI